MLHKLHLIYKKYLIKDSLETNQVISAVSTLLITKLELQIISKSLLWMPRKIYMQLMPL